MPVLLQCNSTARVAPECQEEALSPKCHGFVRPCRGEPERTDHCEDERRAYETDVTPILAMARYELGGAIEPVDTYRASEWRPRKAQERGRASMSAGIV